MKTKPILIPLALLVALVGCAVSQSAAQVDSTGFHKKFIADTMARARVGKKAYRVTAETLFGNYFRNKNEDKMTAFISWFGESADTTLVPVLNEQVKTLKAVMPGKPFVDLEHKNLAGNKQKLSETVAANKLTLLLIWDSNCHHCQDAIKEIKPLYDEYHKLGFEIFGVALNEEAGEWQKYVAGNNLNWQNTCLCGGKHDAQIEKYFIAETPTLVLINQQGIIEHRLVDVKELRKMLTPLN